MMQIIQKCLTNNPCYKANKPLKIKGLMLHSVGTPQPSASAFISNWNKSTTQKCVHAFIDGNDGNVYQTLPWNIQAWHCGSSGNQSHIGVEMCEPKEIKYIRGSQFAVTDYDKAKACAVRTYKSAVALFAMLCINYNLDPLTDICGHAEGYKKGIASNHADPEHLWKGLGLAYSMNTFRQDVKSAMIVKPSGSTTPQPVAGSFKVKVEISNLNIRKGAGTNFAKVGFIPKGTYTIVEVKQGIGSNAGWGKLKSGSGYISLDFVKRV